MSSSIGIIGGADGPTAIFVTTAPGFGWKAAMLAAAVVGILVFLRLRKGKKKQTEKTLSS